MYKFVRPKLYAETNLHVQINVYKFKHTKSYVQNFIKEHIYIYKLICTNSCNTNSCYKFILIYDWQTKQKIFKVQKKGFPLQPMYTGMCTFSTK